MKKLTLSLSVACMTIMSVNAQVSIMPEVGINLSNISAKDNSGGATETYKNKIGWKIGTSFMLPISKSFFFQPGLFFSTKGTRDSYEESFAGATYSYKATLNANYLEMPMNIGYINNLGKAGSLFFTAGPYIGFGISGKSTYREYMNGVLDPGANNEADVFGAEGAMNRFDLGLNLGIGYKLPFGVFVRAQYGTSLLSVSNESDYSVRNKGFSFSTGYVYTFKAPAKSKVSTGTGK